MFLYECKKTLKKIKNKEPNKVDLEKGVITIDKHIVMLKLIINMNISMYCMEENWSKVNWGFPST